MIFFVSEILNECTNEVMIDMFYITHYIVVIQKRISKKKNGHAKTKIRTSMPKKLKQSEINGMMQR